MKKSDFIAATRGKYNMIVEWHGHLISITGWKNKPWELVKDNDFQITCERSYVPIAAFHTREELWKYLKGLSPAP